jgi:predicted amidohydrolase YtcJ
VAAGKLSADPITHRQTNPSKPKNPSHHPPQTRATISFHSDIPMAPAKPLTLVWSAVNRIASDGKVWGADQKLSVDLALRAVTIEAARSVGMEDEIGSLRPGKRADFTVLGADPFEVEPEAIRDIEIWGTVLDGRPHPIRWRSPPPGSHTPRG